MSKWNKLVRDETAYRDFIRDCFSASVKRATQELGDLCGMFTDHDVTPTDVSPEVWEAVKELSAAVEAEQKRRERLQ